MATIHASCVDISGFGVLLRGPSGGGKSDLALRLIDGGARLVADDQVALDALDGTLIASAPGEIAGRLEVRGLGIVEVETVATATVGLIVDLVPRAEIARLPQPASCVLEGISLPAIALAAFDASAAAKVRLARRRAMGDRIPPS